MCFVIGGTTSLLATVTFGASEEGQQLSQRVITTLKEVISKGRGRSNNTLAGGAIIEGIHAEGPIVADLGGLIKGENEMPLDQFQQLLDLMGKDLKIMTIGPSVDSRHGYARSKMLLERGIVVALGHDRQASEEQILGALKLATSEEQRLHMTHLFNVQKFHHREAGLANIGTLKSPSHSSFIFISIQTPSLHAYRPSVPVPCIATVREPH